MQIAVLPDLFGQGWNGRGDPVNDGVAYGVAHVESWGDFIAPRNTDAMAVAYIVPNAPDFPRLNVGADRLMAARGYEPLLSWVMFDIDPDEDHETPWKSLGHATHALIQTMPEGWGGYTTRAGLRLMVPLEPALPVRYASSFLRQLGASLRPPEGYHLGGESYEWTRLMRVPRARRDGQVLESTIIPPSITLDPMAMGFDLVESADREQEWGDAPPEPLTLAWEDLRHLSDMPWAQLGKPVPPNAEGSCYVGLRTALARVAQRGRYEDPHVLASFFWESVLATEGSSLDISELWDLANWVADRQTVSNASNGHDTVLSDELPDELPLTDDEWLQVKTAFKGRGYTTWQKLKDGLPLDRSKTHYEETTYTVLRQACERTELPADTLYRMVLGSAAAQKAPTPPEIWERCQLLVEERERGGDNERAIKRVFCRQYPLTVQLASRGGMTFQLDTTTTPYSYIRTNNDLIEMHFNRRTKPGLPFKADYTNLPVRSILAWFGSDVRKMTYASGLERCRYNHLEHTMDVGVHQLVATKVKEHPEIDVWLRLLGGDYQERFLDWLACVTLTQTQPLCAVYLRCEKSAGKTLLGRGLGSLWGAPPVDYNRAFGSSEFNSDLTLCPVVFADEGIIVNKFNSDSASISFRNAVAGTDHRIRALYQDPVPLRGALRVLITSNDGDGLPFRDSLGREGIDAIVQRVLYLDSRGRGVPEYLYSLGGRQVLSKWVPEDSTPGPLAEHLLWLRQTRKVEADPGARFLVEGIETDWHRAFGARQGIKPGVLQAVFALMMQLRRNGAQAEVPVHDTPKDRLVWVTKNALVRNWDALSRSYQAKSSDIGRALDQLAVKYTSHWFPSVQGSRKAYALPYQAFVDASVCEWDDFLDEEE